MRNNYCYNYNDCNLLSRRFCVDSVQTYSQIIMTVSINYLQLTACGCTINFIWTCRASGERRKILRTKSNIAFPRIHHLRKTTVEDLIQCSPIPFGTKSSEPWDHVAETFGAYIHKIASCFGHILLSSSLLWSGYCTQNFFLYVRYFEVCLGE